MRPARSFFLAAACAALCSISAPAWSQPSPKNKIEAITLTSSGRTALKEGRFQDAITALSRANELDPTAPIKVDLARAQAGAGRLVDASTTLHAIDPTAATTPLEKQATEDSKKLLAEIEARIPWLLVTIQGPKNGKASVTVDGKEVDVTAEVPLDPGEHIVKVEAEGWKPGEEKVTLAEGVHEEVKVQLERDAPPPPPPPPRKPLPPPPPPRTGLNVPLPTKIAFGVGGAGLVVGSVFGVLAFTSTSEAEDRCERNKCPRSARRNIDAALLNGNISTGAFIVGGVGVATGVVLLLTAPKPSAPAPAQTGRARARGTTAESTGAWVRPWVGPGQAGVVGAF